MENSSLFLAEFWGWLLIIFFFILSLNPKRNIQIIKDLEDQKFAILISFITIIFGLLNILFHNMWESNYKLVITLLGWFCFIFGLSLFIFPKKTTKNINYVNIKFVQIIYILLFFIGIYLLNVAYRIVYY
ncbi:hypothetical protein [uncultured Lutibacter sp.]|uniref:hypothetical protein n=1 Tax=uncultured Lutibacter sp. TaxID=437739 RepID=UPI002631F819|nr:hypothetical protein [uncultured Lutibacter sp.]